MPCSMRPTGVQAGDGVVEVAVGQDQAGTAGDIERGVQSFGNQHRVVEGVECQCRERLISGQVLPRLWGLPFQRGSTTAPGVADSWRSRPLRGAAARWRDRAFAGVGKLGPSVAVGSKRRITSIDSFFSAAGFEDGVKTIAAAWVEGAELVGHQAPALGATRPR